ncbi:FAD-binding and (Fe-S)-binding domain-containing protein [Dactylosporangium sp. AC04546]|uniref:FAD-binding and (Fe-S)-binding domain-containing protein n=1 Tax=Dactylosporangium sp. AC04546 TaxID=2862460 RepID=UPI001EDFA608|nr:FAD-binding and (Fe-S)-binding domain-containing protein [Dactylosporangium sp. AC04546]WVK81175.1 FAD-binding and (Fe-S)-binding domain-containing protein [Dactylosporangium sp. AC04546]
MNDVVAALEAAGLEVRADAGTRGMYASDASLYRIPPLAVVRPRHADEVAAALAVARETGVPLTSRGAGTSVAGNAVGRGIVLDFSRHLNRVLAVDPEARTAVVEPGTVHAVLQKAVTPHGVRFGPDPSTHPRCTIGGMIGNNACGSRSLAYGRTSDNVAGLELLTAAGERLVTGYDEAGTPFARGAEPVVEAVRAVMNHHLATARTEFDRFGRQVSGYAAHHLLPERFDLTQALVGSEGTLAVITQATVRLVVDAPVRVVVVLGFPDIVAAGEAAPAVVEHAPTSCEGLDSRLLDVLRARRGPDAVPPLPRGGAWLFVELAGDDAGEVESRARRLAGAGIGGDALVVSDPAVQARLWRIREDGAGLAGRAPSDRPAWPGWEDAAVPPGQLGAYLARFDELVASHKLTSAPFGHFGDGCMHVRLDFPLDQPDGTKLLRDFLTDAARLVGEFGGSLSGEHGDGRARSELLPHMYSADAIALFGGVKHAFDPGNVLNPGVLVDPDPVDADVRPAGRFPLKALALAYPHDGGDLAQAVHRCTGVGKCRADNSAAGGVMCPSYLATREEKDSTRGRARVLQEVVRGELAWSDPSVHDALDLCLSCKGCASDCPTGIDMATYKSEVLHQTYRGRRRPRSHYTLGRLPKWARLAGRMPRLSNLGVRLPVLGPFLLWLAGVDRRRSVPAFARRPFRRTFRPAAGGGTPVVLFADSFSDAFSPEVAEATVRVLRAAGYEPRLPSGSVCCGLTWITTGQLDAAKRILARTVAALAPDARAGVPIVGIEPSCTAVLRSDIHELLPGDEDAAAVAGSVRTLAELLAQTPGWTPPDLSGTEIVAQPHCHHHAVLGWKADAELLQAGGAKVRRLAGCCGLAGNFGVEIGHYEVSVAVAGQQLLPALDAAPDAVVLADGFSCRTQVADLRHRPAVHLAQLLDKGLPGD